MENPDLAAQTHSDVNFCLRCGAALERGVRYGAIRPFCPKCGWVFFHDPKVAAAALIEQNGSILLVRRANDPQRGLWTLPAGFVDGGEDPAEAVERECLEETGLVVRVSGLLDVIGGQEHPRGAHILIVYRAEALAGEMRAGDDVDQIGFFSLDKLPPLAFSTTQKILAHLT